MNDKNCFNCIHFKSHRSHFDQDSMKGDCRYNPPTVHIIHSESTFEKYEAHTLYPCVSDRFWCSKFTKKEEVIEAVE